MGEVGAWASTSLSLNGRWYSACSSRSVQLERSRRPRVGIARLRVLLPIGAPLWVAELVHQMWFAFASVRQRGVQGLAFDFAQAERRLGRKGLIRPLPGSVQPERSRRPSESARQGPVTLTKVTGPGIIRSATPWSAARRAATARPGHAPFPRPAPGYVPLRRDRRASGSAARGSGPASRPQDRPARA